MRYNLLMQVQAPSDLASAVQRLFAAPHPDQPVTGVA
jgi:hypothetical protein